MTRIHVKITSLTLIIDGSVLFPAYPYLHPFKKKKIAIAFSSLPIEIHYRVIICRGVEIAWEGKGEPGDMLIHPLAPRCLPLFPLLPDHHPPQTNPHSEQRALPQSKQLGNDFLIFNEQRVLNLVPIIFLVSSHFKGIISLSTRGEKKGLKNTGLAVSFRHLNHFSIKRSLTLFFQ